MTNRAGNNACDFSGLSASAVARRIAAEANRRGLTQDALIDWVETLPGLGATDMDTSVMLFIDGEQEQPLLHPGDGDEPEWKSLSDG